MGMYHYKWTKIEPKSGLSGKLYFIHRSTHLNIKWAINPIHPNNRLPIRKFRTEFAIYINTRLNLYFFGWPLSYTMINNTMTLPYGKTDIPYGNTGKFYGIFKIQQIKFYSIKSTSRLCFSVFSRLSLTFCLSSVSEVRKSHFLILSYFWTLVIKFLVFYILLRSR